MRKLSEYESHATECRQLAGKMRDPVHKKQLEQMAEAWAMLAEARKKQLLKLSNGHQASLTKEV
jgi:hypothetical protein